MLSSLQEAYSHIMPNDYEEHNNIHAARIQSKISCIATSTLQHPSTLPKNCRFRNTNDHQCNLKSTQRNMPSHLTNHVCTKEDKKETIDSLISGSNKEIWIRSLSDDWGRVAQVNFKGVKGIATIELIHQYQVPKESSVTHASYVCDYRPLKQELHKVRITVGGDRLP